MDVQSYISKNLKYIALILLGLFFIKSFQSCNRNMEVKKLNKEIVYLNDSLNTLHGTEKEALILELQECNIDKQKLEYEVKLANSGKEAAEKRAEAVQSTAEKIRENTTIKIENNSAQDTVSVDNN